MPALCYEKLESSSNVMILIRLCFDEIWIVAVRRKKDPSTPFEVVLGDGLNVEAALPQQERDDIEADSFWCLTKILDGIQDNYTFAQPGIQLKVKQLEELVRRIDNDLHRHLVGQV